MVTIQTETEDILKEKTEEPTSLQKAINDARTGENLYGPYSTAAEAMKALYED